MGKLTKADLFTGDLRAQRNPDSCYAVISDLSGTLCEIDDKENYNDGKAMQRAEYIANAVNCHDELVEMLELAMSHMDGDSIEDFTYQYQGIQQLLAKARGE